MSSQVQKRIHSWSTFKDNDIILTFEGVTFDSFPDIPDIVRHLVFSYNNIYHIPRLPSNLKTLTIVDNPRLKRLCGLPDSLSELICYNNSLEYIQIPPKLKVLNCLKNKLTSLPDLPSTLKSLNCGNNLLTELPELPNSLESLYIHNNFITYIPTLPQKLYSFICCHNLLTRIPKIAEDIHMLDSRFNTHMRFIYLPFSHEYNHSYTQITFFDDIRKNISYIFYNCYYEMVDSEDICDIF
jgi:Leucine-rich repeat (LRR) protein